MPLDVDYVVAKNHIDVILKKLSNVEHGNRENIANKIISFSNRLDNKKNESVFLLMSKNIKNYSEKIHNIYFDKNDCINNINIINLEIENIKNEFEIQNCIKYDECIKLLSNDDFMFSDEYEDMSSKIILFTAKYDILNNIYYILEKDVL